MSFKNPEGQLARWLEELSQYDFQIIHRPGKKHGNADGLLRIPISVSFCNCYTAGSKPELLPCHPCHFCAKAHSQWERFYEDVDDVLPLAIKHSVSSVRQVHSDPSQETDDSGSSETLSQTLDNSLEEETTNSDNTAISNWLVQYSSEELKAKQREDPDLAPIIKWLSEKENPSSHKLYLQSPATKHLWLCKDQLQFKDQVLFYHWNDKINCKLVLLVPKSMKEEILHLCHDTITSGHLGERKTLLRVKRSFLWYGMSKDVKVYVMSCRICSMNKKPTFRHQAGLKLHHAGYPMERVHIDILGPFVESSFGNKYILVMIDQFSKWLECAAIPDQHAETVAGKFLAHFVVTFGCPVEIHSDQGKQFDGNLFKAFYNLLQITKTRTTPYHPASNGQVERYNRVILQLIHCFVGKHAKDWDKHLPLLVMATHAMEHKETGFTPNQLMLGQEVLMPADIIMGITSQYLYTPVEWVKVQAEVIPKIYDLVRKNLLGTLKRRKKDYDLKAKENVFSVGDYVYKRGITTKTGSKALCPVWRGPFLVVDSNPPLYKIQDRKHRNFTIHHDRLKACQDRVIPIWLRRRRNEVLNIDYSFVESDPEDAMLGLQSQDKLDSEPVEIDTPEINTDAQNSADLEETLPYSYGSPNNDKDSAPSSDLDATLPYSQGIPSVNNSDLDKTLPYSQGIPHVNTLPKSNSTDDLYSMESFLEGGVLPKWFKKPKKDKPLILGLQSLVHLLQKVVR